MDKKKFCVYIHTCPDGQKYVGITSQVPEHRWANGHGYDNQWFGIAINRWGWGSIKHEIVAEGLDEQNAKSLEFELIDLLHTWCPGVGYNDSIGYCVRKGTPVRDPSTHQVYFSISQASKCTGKYPYQIKKYFELCSEDNVSRDDVYVHLPR